jgi:hypothetical protein
MPNSFLSASHEGKAAASVEVPPADTRPKGIHVTHHKLKGKRRATLERICGYFHNNTHRMAYDVYHEHGLPIVSSVIEGACRYVVKDRMERSGMRWVMSGARAMLAVRCVYLSGLWEEFIAFRIQRESQRIYPGSAANDPDFGLPLAA